MKIGTVVTWSFLVGFLTIIAGAYLRILHREGTDFLLVTGLLAYLVFIVSAIYEVRTSNRIDSRAKALWTIGFITMSSITGIYYMLIGRRKVADLS
ncbi:hypothetical protein EXU57_00270 [Segetibacter sp. 3557_3]|uniref:hypothetical protein n=1 Tax=Segetibacter sp. 3557_3 TaxID=2547429 RepID=UPI001058A51F|nr:hypothetical protein [Segetibacter sp. 3557_3]TDH28549.1 hypothetical protein EXU57_00270 [Segetibacter sp. 3557_3]